MQESTETEIRILKAAESVFYRKGKDGTSMQDIADEAGITRTSLNYYYRSKDKLFEAVFREALGHFVPKIVLLLDGSKAMTEYLNDMVEIIIDTMLERPQIPVFVLQELSSNPNRMPQIVKELGLSNEKAMKKMRNDELFKRISIDPRHLILNVISLCIFPFAAKPMVLPVMFDGDEEAYIRLMKERKFVIPMMLKQMLNNLEK